MMAGMGAGNKGDAPRDGWRGFIVDMRVQPVASGRVQAEWGHGGGCNKEGRREELRGQERARRARDQETG